MGRHLKTKICTVCTKEKSVDDFYKNKNSKDGLTCECAECIKKRVTAWRNANPDKKLKGDRRRRRNNKEKISKQQHDWYEANKEKVKKAAKKSYAINRKKRIKAAVKWKKENREKARKSACKTSQKMRGASKGKLNSIISGAIWRSLHGSKNNRHWESLVNFTIEDLMKHLGKQFQPGMTWGNYGEWHIDHKIPISVFNFEKPEDDDFKKCWGLKNLQPLWAKDNLKKWNKLNKPFQPSLIFKEL